MKTLHLLDQHGTLEALIQHINHYPIWRRCQLAGRYAYEQAGADYSNDEEMTDDYLSKNGGDCMFIAHLNELLKQGCRFTKHIALEWAKGYADLPFDLGD